MILKIDNVTKNFGGVTAIKETSFSVAPKEIFGLIGPNGAGKTTMFNIITGNYTPSSGQVIFRNEAINGLKPHHIVRKGIARTFQNIRLFSSMSVLDNILIGFDFQRPVATAFFAESRSKPLLPGVLPRELPDHQKRCVQLFPLSRPERVIAALVCPGLRSGYTR